jgi:hypothetical protein
VNQRDIENNIKNRRTYGKTEREGVEGHLEQRDIKNNRKSRKT